MTFVEYLVGCVLLLAATVPIVWGAVRVRRRVLADWSGAPARLGEAIIALAAVLGVAQVLGSVGGFRRASLAGGFAVAGFALAAVGRGKTAAAPRAMEPDVAIEESDASPSILRRAGLIVALLAIAIIAGGWTTRTAASISEGITNQDSLTYHLPHAARFYQEGWITRLHYTDPDFPDTFHPSNAELLHGVGMVFFRRDVLSPILNLGWVALALLAAWCVGRPRRLGSFTLMGAALVLASPILSLPNAGSGSNDVAVLFFLLAAVALLLQPRIGPAATATAAVAAGLAVGTKLTAVVPVAALTIGVLVVWRRFGWRRLAATWVGPLVAGGGFWYVRTLVRTGTPAPSLPLGAGPSPFTSPRFAIVDQYGFSVADYLTDGDVWKDWFLPGLRLDFGWAWWLTFALAVVGAALALTESRAPLIRVLGFAAAAGAVGYAVTPTTALGQEGRPLLFASNLVYLTPALVIALAVLPLLRSARRPLVGWGLLGIMAAALLSSQLTSDLGAWGPSFRSLGAVVAVVTVAIGAAVPALGIRVAASRVSLAMGVAASVVALLAAYPAARIYLRDSYADAPQWNWARNLADERIAIAGFGPQYPFYGMRLSNHVQYVGHEGPHGEFTSVPDCPTWRSALRRGGYTYVVLKPERLTTDVARRELPWTRSDPAARPMLRAAGAEVFRFDPAVPDPGCPAPT